MTPEPIRTDHIFPPIPVRCFDWIAYRDPEGRHGYGPTEAAAIADLLELEADDAPQHDSHLRPYRAARLASKRHKAAPGECATCDRERAAGRVFHPPHDASDNCASGQHDHCTCDTCF